MADEHISHRIVKAINDLARLPDGWNLGSVKKSDFTGMEDEDWIDAFSADGGNGIVSADKQMLKRPTLVRQISSTGLVAIYFPGEFGEGGHKAYPGKGRMYQMAYTAYWWHSMQVTFASASEGTAWIMPRRLHLGEPREIDLTSDESIRKAASA